jgi:DNA-3-methyladenine glycosylase II
MPNGSKNNGTNGVEHRRRTALVAIRRLRQVDPRLGRLIAQIGPFRPDITPDPFIALIGSIIQQQLSMAAATTIYRRVRGLCPRQRLTPKAILALDDDALRGVGLSRQKAAYLRNLADAFATRTLTAAGLRAGSDDEVIAATTAIKGIGRWTAEMLLMFCLERPDVWPVDDLGLRKAVRNFLRLGELPPAAAIRELADPWRPYRSYATWYLWRSLEGPLMPGVAL